MADQPVKNKHVFNLDALERKSKPRPFAVRHNETIYTFADPFEQNWQDAVAVDLNDVEGSLKPLLGDQYEDFKKSPMPMWKLQALSKAVEAHYAKYYGSEGEGDASAGS